MTDYHDLLNAPPKRTRKRVYYSKCALCGKVGRTSGPNPAGIINGLVFGKPGWMFVHVSCYNKQVQIPIRRAG